MERVKMEPDFKTKLQHEVEYILCEPTIKMEPDTSQSGDEIDPDVEASISVADNPSTGTKFETSRGNWEEIHSLSSIAQKSGYTPFMTIFPNKNCLIKQIVTANSKHLKKSCAPSRVKVKKSDERVNSIAGTEAESQNVAERLALTAVSFKCDLRQVKFPTKQSLVKPKTGLCIKNLCSPSTAVDSLVANSEHGTLSVETFKCSCKMQFKDVMELEKHVLHNPEKGCVIIRCKFCSKVFNNTSIRNEHLLTHTGEKKYECKFCPKQFNQSSSRNQHLLTHTGEKKYACKFCPKLFTVSGNRNQHLRTHTGEKKYSCKFCRKRFSQSSNRNKHLQTHKNKDANSVGGEQPVNLILHEKHLNPMDSLSLTAVSLECDLCLAKFPTKKSLTKHVTGSCFKDLFPPSTVVDGLVANGETFKCSCKMQFKDVVELEQHVLHNPKKGCVIVRCKFCSKLFNNIRKRNKHLQTHTGEKKFECKFCPKRFRQSHTRNRHLLTHTGEKKYACKFCPMLFTETGNRNKHLLTHTGEKKFECKFCPKLFSRSNNRNVHLLTHAPEKKYECIFCQKLFSDSTSRDLHLLNHTGEKKYACKFCPKLFSRSSSRNQHLLTHTGEKKYACNFCPKLFRQSWNRNQHLLTHNDNGVKSVPEAETVNF